MSKNNHHENILKMSDQPLYPFSFYRPSDCITYGICLALSSFVVLLALTPDYTIDPIILRLVSLSAMSFVLIAGQKQFTRAKIFEVP